MSMPTAYCPGHITCMFAPGRTSGDYDSRGSRGVGIRLSAGARVTVKEVSGNRVDVIMDGQPSDAPITRAVVSAILPGRGLEVKVENGLPMGQGFGMSAAGAIAAALSASEMAGVSEDIAWSVAHRAEIECGGGLGDVSALRCLADVPERVTEGLPPVGEVVGTGVHFPVLTVAVLGPKMHTGGVLADPVNRRNLIAAYSGCRGVFKGDRQSLLDASMRFSEMAKVESEEVSEAIRTLRSGNRKAAMCMLGNSIFSDAPMLMVKDALPDAKVISLMSSSERARLIR